MSHYWLFSFGENLFHQINGTASEEDKDLLPVLYIYNPLFVSESINCKENLSCYSTLIQFDPLATCPICVASGKYKAKQS